MRWPSLSTVAGLGLVVLVAGVAFVLVRDADVLAIRLQTRVLAPPGSAPTTPRAAVEYFQCNRCHVVPGLEPASARLNENCVTCHQAIQAGRLDRWYDAAQVATWNSHLVHLMRTPDLGSLRQRVTRAWLVAFLQTPHVVRPLYGATMPRLKIGARDAELLADFFQVTQAADPSARPVGDVEKGRALFTQKACLACHFRGEAPRPRYGAPEYRESPPARRQAPDLAQVAQRMSLAQLRAWLANPQAVLPETAMPAFHFTPSEVEDLATFLLLEPLPPPRAVPPRRTPRVLDREVHYPEVAQKLSRHLCFHCHSDQRRPGDQGPGNSGGLGYSGVSLDLATREGIVRGVKRDGQFRGQPDRLLDGTPRLVASLLARQAELEGQVDPDVLGMPLGFPPIPDEEIDLVNTWLEQGARE